MEKLNFKNIILAILVAYVVTDLTCSVILKHPRQLLVSQLTGSKRKERRKMIGCIILGLIVGTGVYYALHTGFF